MRMAAKNGARKGSKKDDDNKSKLEERLLLKEEMIWDGVSKKDEGAMMEFAEGYKRFLTEGKGTREVVRLIVGQAEAAGFKELTKVKGAKPGTKVYLVNRGKGVAMAVLGKRPVEDGFRVVASHIDSPRLDLKQKPLFEDGATKLALFRTHYYGGIKKYHWVSTPMSIHGTVVLADGRSVDISIGEGPDDPVLTIPDLLIHLWRQSQAKRKTPETVKGEELNVLVASRPVDDEKAKEKVKLAVMDHLNREYGMVEEDFISAELEVVPAGPARDVGLDRSMVGGYGQDDRVCAYTCLQAINGVKVPERTSIALFVDKEEIGSDSNTSIKSRFFQNFVGDLLALSDPAYPDSTLRRALSLSKCLSSDVNAGINPNFKDVHEAQNAALIGRGIVLTKFTGSGGKFSANDASAEYVGEVRRMLNMAGIPWQYGALGKVDEGGGGTVAKFMAELDMDVIDAGTALLSMHSPFEISSKADVYFTFRAFEEFYRAL
jgi:aspartyl aminopeptidase